MRGVVVGRKKRATAETAEIVSGVCAAQSPDHVDLGPLHARSAAAPALRGKP